MTKTTVLNILRKEHLHNAMQISKQPAPHCLENPNLPQDHADLGCVDLGVDVVQCSP